MFLGLLGPKDIHMELVLSLIYSLVFNFRVDEAIQILEYVVGTREEKLGTANPVVDDEKRRLSELLKEAGRVRSRAARSLETLLDANNASTSENTAT